MWLPKDGQADPVNITQALAKGARNFGVAIHQGIRVTGITKQAGSITGVTTDLVILPPIMWSMRVACGHVISVIWQCSGAAYACEHFYIVTEAMPDLTPNLPVLRVPDECVIERGCRKNSVMRGTKFETMGQEWHS